MKNPIPKTTGDVIDYLMDWSDEMAKVSPADTILTSTWTVTQSITIDSDSNTDDTATVWVSGGNVGQLGELTNKMVSAGGRTLYRTIIVPIRETIEAE